MNSVHFALLVEKNLDLKNMQNTKYKNSLYIIIISLLLSCKGEDGAVGPSGLNSLIQTINEPAGSNCEFGGLKIESGIDNNANGTLDTDEILKTDYVCSAAGKNSLVNVVDEPAGSNCDDGGIKIETGIDSNNDGSLEVSEIQFTDYICHGTSVNQTRIMFGWGAGTSSDQWTVFDNGNGHSLYKFNIDNYPNVTSVTFGTLLKSTDVETNCVVELYDLTNDVVIANSTIESNSSTGEFKTSANILNDLPSGTVDLTYRLRSSTDGVFVSTGFKFYIFIE